MKNGNFIFIVLAALLNMVEKSKMEKHTHEEDANMKQEKETSEEELTDDQLENLIHSIKIEM